MKKTKELKKKTVEKKPITKKTTKKVVKKVALKKATPKKKAVTKKATVKKAAVKKPVVKKAAPKKKVVAKKKSVIKKTPVKKVTPKKVTKKKTAKKSKSVNSITAEIIARKKAEWNVVTRELVLEVNDKYKHKLNKHKRKIKKLQAKMHNHDLTTLVPIIVDKRSKKVTKLNEKIKKLNNEISDIRKIVKKHQYQVTKLKNLIDFEVNLNERIKKTNDNKAEHKAKNLVYKLASGQSIYKELDLHSDPKVIKTIDKTKFIKTEQQKRDENRKMLEFEKRLEKIQAQEAKRKIRDQKRKIKELEKLNAEKEKEDARYQALLEEAKLSALHQARNDYDNFVEEKKLEYEAKINEIKLNSPLNKQTLKQKAMLKKLKAEIDENNKKISEINSKISQLDPQKRNESIDNTQLIEELEKTREINLSLLSDYNKTIEDAYERSIKELEESKDND